MIQLPTDIFNAIRQVQLSKIFTREELRQVETVAWYLDSVKENKAADWVRANYVEYLQGLTEGFEVDNSQEQQLKDIHAG